MIPIQRVDIPWWLVLLCIVVWSFIPFANWLHKREKKKFDEWAKEDHEIIKKWKKEQGL